MLRGLGLEEENTEFTVCVVVNCCEGEAENVKKVVDDVFGNKDWPGHLVKPLRKEITKEGGGPKLSYSSKVSGNKVVGAFKLPPEVANMELLK
jgi:hypothetical protein